MLGSASTTSASYGPGARIGPSSARAVEAAAIAMESAHRVDRRVLIILVLPRYKSAMHSTGRGPNLPRDREGDAGQRLGRDFLEQGAEPLHRRALHVEVKA